MEIADVVDLDKYPLDQPDFRRRSRRTLDQTGVLVLPDFLRPASVAAIRTEGEAHKHQAYYCVQEHNVYLTQPDGDFDMRHPRNRLVSSSKGCITHDQVPADSHLRVIYDSARFRDFLCQVLGEAALYEYADPLSSINLNYAEPSQELGWHFDNSAFSITLMIEQPAQGGAFEYVGGLRDAEKGEMNFEGVGRVLDGETDVRQLRMPPGALVLSRGRNAIHRVAPVEGDTTRMLVVLAYNSQPGISLSESARLTFFGRLN